MPYVYINLTSCQYPNTNTWKVLGIIALLPFAAGAFSNSAVGK
jgi:hypothetical protein